VSRDECIDRLRNAALERCKQRVEDARKNGKPKLLYGVTADMKRSVSSGIKRKWGL
jgi:hypothetical protein